jgi:polyisoprenoid-binding protein YceI
MLRPAHAVLALAAVMAACAPVSREMAPERAFGAQQVPEDFPRSAYQKAAAQGKAVYRVEPARSLVAITVRRGGAFARLGHDHVVASHDLQGYVAPDLGRADLYFPLASLSVDEPTLRAEAQMETQPTEADIAGTRGNMLDKVLQVQRFPFVLIRVTRVKTVADDTQLGVAITLRGVTRRYEVPAKLEVGRAEMAVAGSFEINQSDFGIAPFSVLNGAIQVQDRLGLRFDIRAGPADLQPDELAERPGASP